jgi:tetratricopeptide (TPR) repeat protein
MADDIDELRATIRRTKDRATKAKLLCDLAWRLQGSDPSDGLDAAGQALTIARRVGDSSLEAQALFWCGYSLHFLSRNDEALERFESSQRIADAIGDRPTQAHARFGMGIALNGTNQIRRALEVLWEALEIARDATLLSLESSIHNSLGIAYRSICDFDRALKHCEECRRLSVEAGHRLGEARSAMNIGVVYMVLGDERQAELHFRNALAITREVGDRVLEAHVVANLATVLVDDETSDEAIALLDEAFQLARSLQLPAIESYALSLLGKRRRARGEHDAAIDMLGRAWQIARDLKAEASWSILGHLAAAVNAHRGPREARPLFEEALAGAREKGDRVLEADMLDALARCHEAEGELATALDLTRQAANARSEATARRHHEALAEARLREEVDRAYREREIARAEAERAEQQSARRAGELTALALELAGKNHFIAGLRSQLAVLTRSTDRSTGGAIARIVNDIERLAGAESAWQVFEKQFEMVHGGFVARLATAYPTLSAAEIKVCALLRINMSSNQIADILDLSRRTVENHRLHIRAKLGLSEGAHLATAIAGV